MPAPQQTHDMNVRIYPSPPASIYNGFIFTGGGEGPTGPSFWCCLASERRLKNNTASDGCLC